MKNNMYTPTIAECIEGSYKEGFELCWTQVKNVIKIEASSISRPWRFISNSIVVNIARDLAKYYPSLKVEWV